MSANIRLNRSAVAAQPGLVLSGAGTNDAATSALPVTQDSTTAVIYDKLDSIDSPHETTITLVGVPHESSDLLLKAPSVIYFRRGHVASISTMVWGGNEWQLSCA